GRRHLADAHPSPSLHTMCGCRIPSISAGRGLPIRVEDIQHQRRPSTTDHEILSKTISFMYIAVSRRSSRAVFEITRPNTGCRRRHGNGRRRPRSPPPVSRGAGQPQDFAAYGSTVVELRSPAVAVTDTSPPAMDAARVANACDTALPGCSSAHSLPPYGEVTAILSGLSSSLVVFTISCTLPATQRASV